MISSENQRKNKERFLSLVNMIATLQPDRGDWEGLINYLSNSDFFTAPASTIFHDNCVGGLCDHSLKVYDSIIMMNNKMFNTDTEVYRDTRLNDPSIRHNYEEAGPMWESLAICSLFHDIGKTNQYVIGTKNVKDYCPNGSKRDSGGTYEWITIQSWFTQKLKDRTEPVLMQHEISGVFRLLNYIALTDDEIQAIMYHSGWSKNDDFSEGKEVTFVYASNHLAALVHSADTFSSVCLEDNGVLNE